MSKRQFYVALIVLAVSGLMGGVLSTWLLPGRAAYAQEQAAAQEIRAEKFVLVDAAGKTRAMLYLLDGRPGLVFYDEAGKPRAILEILDGEPVLQFASAAGKPRAALGAQGLTLYDAVGMPRAAVRLSDDEPKFYVFDEAGRTRWQAP
jgi:hypothetical protein